MTTKINEETGLPELPEGYYWETKLSSTGRRYYYLHLMKKSWIFRWSVSDKMLGELTKWDIRRSAEIIYNDVFGDHPAEEGLLGKFPPNTVKD